MYYLPLFHFLIQEMFMTDDFPIHGDSGVKYRRSHLGPHKLPRLLYCLSHLPNDHTNFRKIFHEPCFKTSTRSQYLFYLVHIYLWKIFSRLVVIPICFIVAQCQYFIRLTCNLWHDLFKISRRPAVVLYRFQFVY